MIHHQHKEKMKSEDEFEQKAVLIMAYNELAWNNQEKGDLANAIININKMLKMIGFIAIVSGKNCPRWNEIRFARNKFHNPILINCSP